MSYRETDCNLCRQCYIAIKHPPKKAIKKMELTSYKDMCEECGRMNRLVEYVWEKEDDDD